MPLEKVSCQIIAARTRRAGYVLAVSIPYFSQLRQYITHLSVSCPKLVIRDQKSEKTLEIETIALATAFRQPPRELDSQVIQFGC